MAHTGQRCLAVLAAPSLAAVVALAGARQAAAAAPAATAAAAAVAAAAANEEITARLSVEAAADCTTRAEVAARVARRSARIRFVDRAAGSPALHVRIAAGGGRAAIAAELTIVRPDGQRWVRRLLAATCAEASDAVALVIAILLDPAATPEVSTGAVAGTGGGTGASTAVAAGVTAAPVAAAAGATAAPETAASRPATPPPVDARPPIPPAVRRLGVSAALRGISGPAPHQMPGIAVGGMLSFDRDSIWSPALRVLATHYARSGWAAPGGTADFALDVLDLDLCPVWLRGGRFGVRGCATAVAGRLWARGYETYDPESHARPFASLGGTAVLTAAVGTRLELSAAAGGGMALVRDAFAFAPEVFHRVPAATLTLGLGAALTFP
jgi:hypothetical protein